MWMMQLAVMGLPLLLLLLLLLLHLLPPLTLLLLHLLCCSSNCRMRVMHSRKRFRLAFRC
jgi:hypothetical protein